MFASLKNVLEDCGVAQGNEFSHLITDTPYASGTPLVVYHLVNSLNDGKKVCFLTFQNTWSHYCNICNKFGVNLRSKSNENTVEVIELMKHLLQVLTNTNDNNTNTVTSNILDFLITDVEYPLKELYSNVKSIIEQLKEQDSSVSLIIDSITPLLNLGVSEKEVEIFIHYCYNLLNVEKDTLVISCTQLGSSNILTNRLTHKFSVRLAVNGLSTGGSKDIHGELKVSKNSTMFDVRKESKYHFKVEERDVKVFPVGFASKTL